MIYGKLPVILMNALATEKEGSTNQTIAKYIIAHREELQQTDIRELAEKTHVSISSISRFARELGFHDFQELRELLAQEPGLPEILPGQFTALPGAYYAAVAGELEEVKNQISMQKVREICRMIHAYESVSVYGLFKGETAAMNLVSDLALLGKPAQTFVAYKEQVESFKSMGKDELLILFSYSGSYFDYEYLALPAYFRKPKIVMITGGKEPHDAYIDYYMHFPTSDSLLGHPYSMLFLAGLIAQTYGKMYAGGVAGDPSDKE